MVNSATIRSLVLKRSLLLLVIQWFKILVIVNFEFWSWIRIIQHHILLIILFINKTLIIQSCWHVFDHESLRCPRSDSLLWNYIAILCFILKWRESVIFFGIIYLNYICVHPLSVILRVICFRKMGVHIIYKFILAWYFISIAAPFRSTHVRHSPIRKLSWLKLLLLWL